MTFGKIDIIEAGTLKVTVRAVSHVQTYSLQVTDIISDGALGDPVVFSSDLLSQGVAFPLVSQHRYLLDLVIVKTGDPCTVEVKITRNGSPLWEETKRGDSGSWEYTVL